MAESRSQSGGGGFLGKMKGLGDKFKASSLEDAKIKATHIKNNMGKFANIINPNHRHDEEHEKKTDNKRTQISESHRFNSFAPERYGNNVKWYVDARDYFWVSQEHATSITPAHATVEHLYSIRASQGDDLYRGLVAITRACELPSAVCSNSGSFS